MFIHLFYVLCYFFDVYKGSLAQIIRGLLRLYGKTKTPRATEQITIEIDSELLYKYNEICKHYGHNLDEQMEITMKDYIYNYEINNGPIGLINYRVRGMKAKNSGN